MSAADATNETPPGDRSDSKEKTRKPKAEEQSDMEDDSVAEKKEDQAMKTDEDGNLVLEDGTMVVEPEDADNGDGDDNGEDDDDDDVAAETSKSSAKVKSESKAKKAFDPDQILTCTACNKQINPNVSGNLRRHPVLRVLICKKCYQWYTSDEIDQDSNGIDEQCRWCGEGGNLLCCDFCHNAFCKKCIKRNLGRSQLQDIQEADDDEKWKCYVCKSDPLEKLRGECDDLINSFEEEEKKKKAAEEKRKLDKEQRRSLKNEGSSKKGQRGKRSNRSRSTSSERPPKRSSMKASKDVVKLSRKLISEDDNFVITPDILNEALEKMMLSAETINNELLSLKTQLSDAVKATDVSKLDEVKKKLCDQLKDLMLRNTKETRQIVMFVKTHNQMDPTLNLAQSDLLEGEQFGRVVTMPDNKQMIVLKDGRSFPFDGNVPKGYKMVIQQRAQPKVPLKHGEVIELTDSEEESEDMGNKSRSPKKAFQFRINLSGKGRVLSLPTQKKSPKGMGVAKKQTKKETKKIGAEENAESKETKEPTPGSSKSDVKAEVKEEKKSESTTDDDKENKEQAHNGQTNGSVEPGRAVMELAEAVTNGLLDEIEPMDINNGEEEKLVQLDGTDVETDSVYIQLKPVDDDDSDEDADDVMNGDLDDPETQDTEEEEDKKEENVKEERPVRKSARDASKRKRLTEVSENSDSDTKTPKSKRPRAQTSARSREDIEAQRKLHRELQEDESSDEEDTDSEFDSDSDESDIPSSGDEYDPTGDYKTLVRDRQENIEKAETKKEKEDKGRVRSYMKKTTVKRRKKKNKDKDSKKGKGSKKSKKGKDDDSDEDSKKKKKSKRAKKDPDDESDDEDSKKKKKSRRAKKDSDDESDDEDSKKKKKSRRAKKDSDESDDEDSKKKKKSKRSKKDSEDESDDDEDDKGKKKSIKKEDPKKKKKKSKDSDDESDEEDSKTKKKSKKSKNSDESEEEENKAKKKSRKSKDSDEESEEEDTKTKKKSKKSKDSDDESKEEDSKRKKKTRNSKDSDMEDEDSNRKKKSKHSKDSGDESEAEDSKKKKKQRKRAEDSDDESQTDDKGKSEKKSKKKAEESEEEDGESKEKLKSSKDADEESEKEESKRKKTTRSSKDCDMEDQEESKTKKKNVKDSEKKMKQEKLSEGSDDESQAADKRKAKKESTKQKKESDEKDTKSKKKSKSSKDSDGGSEKEDSKRKKTVRSSEDCSNELEESQSEDEGKSMKESKKNAEKSNEEESRTKRGLKSKKSQSSGEESGDEKSSKEKSSKERRTSKRTKVKEELSDADEEKEESTKLKNKKDSDEEKEESTKLKKKKESDEKIKESKQSRKAEKSKEAESDEETDKKENKKSNKSKGKPKGKKEDEGHSDESDFDPDLEKEIEKLGKMPVLKLKKLKIERKKNGDMQVTEADGDSNKDEDGKTDKEKKGEEKKKELKGADRGRKGREDKANPLDELDSDASDGEQESEEEESQDVRQVPAMDSDEEFEHKKKIAEEKKKMDKEEQARKALLATSSEEDANDDDDDDDMEDDTKKAKESSKKKQKKKDDSESADDEDEEDDEIGTKKSKTIRNKLLDAKISSDDDSDVGVKNKKKKAADSDDDFEDTPKKKKKKKDSDDSMEDSDSDIGKKKGKKKGKKSSSEEDSDSDAKGKKKRRRRIKVAKSSDSESDSDTATPRRKKKKKKGSEDEDDDEDGSGKKAKNIRKIIKDKKLKEETKAAAKAEDERRLRMKERQQKYNQVIIEAAEAAGGKTACPVTTKLVLESNEDGEPVMEVHPQLICKLKPHQVEAVKFLWDCTVESLDRLRNEEGGGCILAHCMGLGKTLSVIAFVHTLMSKRKKTKISKTLVVCPLNTVLNWQREWQKWFEDIDDDTLWTPLVYELSSVKNNWGRADNLAEWHEDGGIMILSYEMYRNLTQHKFTKNKKQKKIFTETLVDPGPDLVICDEGHVLKNSTTALAKAMNAVRSRRRIILTGTPLQNNLIEYHCMVDFVKPNLLGTKQEFANRFVNPITNGQCSDSSVMDVKVMKKRAHILHETLAGCVQRQDYTCLTKFLPPKHEYVILVRLCPLQLKLYEGYLNKSGQVDGQVVTRGGRIFQDFNNLMRIWTHPWILKLDEIRQENKRTYDSESSFLDDEDDESEMSLSSSEDDKKKKKKKDSEEPKPGTSSGRGNGDDGNPEIVKEWKTRSRRRQALENGEEEDPLETGKVEEDSKVSSEWWAEFLTPDDRYNINLSAKITLLAEVLKMSEAIGDKVLVFSQSLLSLDMIEDFLEHWDAEEDCQVAGVQGWTHGIDYFRMDGSTQAHVRKRWQEEFNDPENIKARLFLISTRAGGIGINLVGANRVIIFDSSWNPSHDVQSIFRVYRFGQEKPVYIYRFLSQGTMEEKIYNRQVTKQSLALRVMDEQQIERHFTYSDLKELYTFTPDRLDDGTEKPTPKLPKDRMLAEMLTDKKDWIVNYHEHDSLLENKVEEDLTEDDRKAAWEEYEQEKKGIRKNYTFPSMNNYNAAMALQMQQQQMMMQQRAAMGYPNVSENQLTHYAKLLYDSNPNMTAEELQQRLQQLVQLQMQQQMQQQQQMMLQRQLEKARQDNQRQQEQNRQLLAHYQQQKKDATGAMARPQSFPNLNSVMGHDRPEVEEDDEGGTLKDLLKFGQK